MFNKDKSTILHISSLFLFGPKITAVNFHFQNLISAHFSVITFFLHLLSSLKQEQHARMLYPTLVH